MADRRPLWAHERVAAWARRAPANPAIVSADERLTYGDLNRRANQLAHRLRAAGVGPDTPTAVLLPRSADLVVALLAVLKAGGAYLPLDPATPGERLAALLADAAAPALVTQRPLLAPAFAAGRCVVCLDAERAALAAEPAHDPASAVGADHLAYLVFTSGSTGEPKGVAIRHGGLANLIDWHQRAFAVTAADRATHLASPAFDAAGWELWPYLGAGASVHLPDAATLRHAGALRDWLLDHGVTISFAPTPLAEELIALDWPERPPLRALLTGADTLRRFPPPTLPFVLVNNYGPTEATVVAASGPTPPAEPPDRLPTLGRPITGARVHILDRQLRPLPTGESGELFIGGIGLARGYHRRAAQTAARFLPDPFSDAPGARLFRTGDLARVLPDGRLAFLGRIDEQVKIRGWRIEPEEVAATLHQHPAVQTSLVVAREDVPGVRRLVAYVVPAAEGALAAAPLRAFLAERLPAYMVPAAVVIVPALPRTGNGKFDRAALPAPPTEDCAAGPEATVADLLAGMLAALLGADHLDRAANFFYVGGHSLLGTQLIARVADRFGVELGLQDVFDAPTISALAAEVERRLLDALTADGRAEG